jgi:phosphopantetheinyl transferase
MPLHTHRDLEEHARLVIWEIEEEPGWFLSELDLDDEEVEQYNGFMTDQRRVHWLAYRHILKNIVGRGSQIRIRYDHCSKPFIDLSEDHISVTHSGKYAAVIMSRQSRVGIDIEQVHPRLHKVAGKFLSPEEGGAEAQASTENLCLHWCAKEALYKLYGQRQLDFREHIKVLQPPEKLEGTFSGKILLQGQEQHYQLRSERLGDYFLVYAIESA